MTTTTQEYYSNLAILQNVNHPIHAALPAAEQIYYINTDTREVEAPPFISVEKDHKSETIYFMVDRFVDYMDLATTCCLISYNNAKGQSGYYPVPFYDLYTKNKDNKIVLPWCIDAWAAQTSGTIEFSFQFFKIENVYDPVLRVPTPTVVYSLNTIPVKTKILSGIATGEIVEDYILNATQAQTLQSQIDQIARSQQLHWTVLTAPLVAPVNSAPVQEQLLASSEETNTEEEKATWI